MSAITEIQAVIDRLQQEGHVVATRLENALKEIKAHFVKDESALATEVEADVAQVETDAEPVVAEAEADVKTVAAEVVGDAKAEAQAAVADLKAAVKK